MEICTKDVLVVTVASACTYGNQLPASLRICLVNKQKLLPLLNLTLGHIFLVSVVESVDEVLVVVLDKYCGC